MEPGTSDHLQEAIDALDFLDQTELNELIVAIRARANELAASAIRTFRVGDTVSFVGKRGQRVFATVSRINRTRVIVKQRDTTMANGITLPGGMWSVAPSLLQAEKPIEQKTG